MKKKEPIGIKNPKGITFNGRSFNEYFVAKHDLQSWIKYGKEQFAGTPFIGNRNDKQQEELLTQVHKAATDMVTPKSEEPAKIEVPKDKKDK